MVLHLRMPVERRNLQTFDTLLPAALRRIRIGTRWAYERNIPSRDRSEVFP